MRLRLVSFVIVVLVALAALIASDRAQPILLVDQQSPGQWTFSKTDYPLCVTVRPPVLKNVQRKTIEGTQEVSAIT